MKYRQLLQPTVRSILATGSRSSTVVKRLLFSMTKIDGNRPTSDLFRPGSPSKTDIYSHSAAGPVQRLGPKELARFKRDGWIGPFPLLQPNGARIASTVHERFVHKFQEPTEKMADDPNAFEQRPWVKSMHAYLPELFDIASHPAIVNRIASILGPDIMAWGFSANHYRPGITHRWHADVEHLRWKGVTVFLALKNISLASTLKVINGSHLIRRPPQEMGITDDASALALSRKFLKSPKVVPVPLSAGQFFIFDGPLWHGSRNTSYRTRSAAVIQYSRPDQCVQVPLNWNEPIQWHPTPPPCVLVKGRDRKKVNRLVSRPGGPKG